MSNSTDTDFNSTFDDFLSDHNFRAGDEVELLIGDRTDLGFKATINNRYEGLLYHNEIFEPVNPGEVKRGYIRQVRDDGKIDLSLQQQGFEHVIGSRDVIMQQLRTNQGILPFGDKTNPEEIYRKFKLSKKLLRK